MMKKTETKKMLYIDYACPVGERVFWLNWRKERFEGVITEWNEEVATVRLDDGTIMEVPC